MVTLKLSESQKEGTIKWGLGFLFFFIGCWLVVQPGIKKIDLIKKGNEEAGRRSELAADLRHLRKQYERLEEFLVPESRQHLFLGKVTALAKASGLEIISLKPSEEPGEYYARLILNLNVKTEFLSLIQFLNQLETVKPPVLVSRIQINSLSQREPRSPGGGGIEVSLTLESYMKKGAKS